MPYHADSTYIQTSNQVIRDQKPRKTTQKGYMTPPHLNLTISSLGAEEPQLRTKVQNKESKIREKYVRTNTQIQNTVSPYQLKSHTYVHKEHQQQQIFTKPRTTPIAKHNYTQKTYKGDHSPLSSINLKFHIKIDHLNNHNPKYPQL